MVEQVVFSKLPTCIIHYIMSLLERKDIVRMQILSKTWRGIYELYPCLEFYESRHMKSSIPLAPKYRFRELVDVTLRRFREQRLYITSFDLVMHLDVEYDSARLNAWIELLITECNVKEIILWIGFCEPHRLPGILFTSSSLTKFITTGGSINYTDSMIFGQCSLRILELEYVTIDEEVIKNLKYCCPFLESISVSWCYGYKRFIVDGLNRLKSLNYCHNVDARDVSIVIAEASSLEVLDLSNINRKCQVSVTSDCGLTELKRLVLTNFSREGEFVENVIRMSSCSLEHLQLSSCGVTPKEMVVSSPSLKTVIIENLGNLQKIEFDTPKLCSFTFRGKRMHPLLLPDDIPSSRRQWSAQLDVSHKTIDNAWFRKLVTFVGTNQFQVFTLDMRHGNIKDISLAESLVSSAKVPIKLDKLQIDCYQTYAFENYDISALLDALIINFRPRHLSFRFQNHSGKVYPSNSKVLEYLGQHSKTERGLPCCESSPLKCWRHFLKGGVERIDENSREFMSYELLWS